MTGNTLDTLEERLSALERDMAQVKARLEPETVSHPHPWVEYVFGAFKDDPLFEEAVRYGREWREAQDAAEEAEDALPDGHE